MVAQPLGEHLLVQGDERGDEGLSVPDDEHLADERVAAQAVLELGGGDVLASGGDDELLLAPGDPKEALSASKEPMSPVRSQPSAVKASAVASGLLW